MCKSNKRLKLGLKINIEIGTIKQRPRFKHQRDQIQNQTKLSGKETNRLTLVFPITQKKAPHRNSTKIRGENTDGRKPTPAAYGELVTPRVITP